MSNFFFTLIFLTSTRISIGQNLVGLFAGPNLATYNYNPNSLSSVRSDYEYKNSFYIGVHMKDRKNKYVNLIADANYLYREVAGQWIQLSPSRYSRIHIDARIHTINFKVVPELRLGDKNAFYINLGPFVSNVVRTQLSTINTSQNYMDPTILKTTSHHGSNKYNGINLGFSFSAGLELQMKEKLFFLIDLNYNKSFPGQDSRSWTESRNSTITVGLVYMLEKFTLAKEILPQPRPKTVGI